MDRTRTYIGSTHQELSGVELEAFQRGYEAARAMPGAQPSLGEALHAAALVALRTALCEYAPLDLAKFHDSFVRGWKRGYEAGVTSAEPAPVRQAPTVH